MPRKTVYIEDDAKAAEVYAEEMNLSRYRVFRALMADSLGHSTSYLHTLAKVSPAAFSVWKDSCVTKGLVTEEKGKVNTKRVILKITERGKMLVRFYETQIKELAV